MTSKQKRQKILTYQAEHGCSYKEAKTALGFDKKAQSTPNHDDAKTLVGRKLSKTDETVAVGVVFLDDVTGKIATLYFDAQPEQIEKAKRKLSKFTKYDLVPSIGHVIRKNAHMEKATSHRLAEAIMAYLAQTETWQIVQAMGVDGVVLKVFRLARHNYLIRPGDLCVGYDMVAPLVNEYAQGHHQELMYH